MATPSIYDVLGCIADADEALEHVDSSSDVYELRIREHLQQMDKMNFRVPEFVPGLDWLNVSEPLSFGTHLAGQIVVLDFFTYCCINCMHILPDLEAVEERFSPLTGVSIVGVHSAKFLNEKVTANIKSAILRYNITHPVVNDSDGVLWQALAVSCWPTLVFIGPSGQLLYTVAGEGHRNKILDFLNIAVDYYSSLVKPSTLPINFEMDKVPTSCLRFPGKINYWPEKQRLIITDTGNHRIVIIDKNGVVQDVIGSGIKGFKDGSYSEAQFSSPQGVTLDDIYLYVADTENHRVRIVNLQTQTVSTLVGTGKQGTDKFGGKHADEQDIASPWDVVKVPKKNTDLLIAMAGSHQIWAYRFDPSYESYPCVSIAGSGKEENRNSSYPSTAGFAQPSGLALMGDKELFIADSESSSVRKFSLTDMKVSNVVGGERDPMNLFAYGDVDGKGVEAKLQHPLHVALLTPEGPLLVADSYNHKIKEINLTTSECSTLAGSGHPGSLLHSNNLKLCELNEPGGLCVNQSQGLIYVADTNNHSIKIIDYGKNTMTELPVIFPEETDNKKDTVIKSSEQDVEFVLHEIRLTPSDLSQPKTLMLPFQLAPGQHVNVEAPNRWHVSAFERGTADLLGLFPKSHLRGDVVEFNMNEDGISGTMSLTLNLPHDLPQEKLTLKLACQLFVCLNDNDICLPPRLLHFRQSLIISK